MNGEAGKAGKTSPFYVEKGKMAGKPLQNSSILAGFFSVGEWQPCISRKHQPGWFILPLFQLFKDVDQPVRGVLSPVY